MKKSIKYILSLAPVVFLILFLAIVIRIYGIDALSGPSQLVLIASTGIAVLIAMLYFHQSWKTLEEEINHSIGSIGSPICILLLIAIVFAVIFQPQILVEISGMQEVSVVSLLKGALQSGFGKTAVDSGFEPVNELLATRGMAGMLNSVWIILCAICFGGVLKASGMLANIVELIVPLTKTRVGLVASTVFSGIFFNATAADQFLSIMLNASMFGEIYEEEGYESRLLSRSIEDSSTVTSVLIPWSTCGMTQSTVLNVPTLTYLPYCFFNILAPLTSIVIAATGFKIFRTVKH